ncbi:MAG: cyclase family protein [Anaerolineales bacterium]|nr:cyclase family protein [Anaerolineales bacterium]
MQIYDVSLGITPTLPVWPGNPGIELARVNDMRAGASSNVSRLALGVHTGTHVDAPVHFFNGAPGVETLPLAVLIGPAVVIHLPAINRVTAAALESAAIPVGTERLLIRTRNSLYWAGGDTEFHTDFVGIAKDAADWIVRRQIKLVGVDYLSVAPWKESHPTHEALLQASVVVVEGLNLAAIAPGSYQFTCLPLKLVGSDGAPARAVLLGD